jgi:hypothetical protein
MNQVWNIFRKDVRHHWPEIGASLALLVTFAWLDIRSWTRFDSGMAVGATGLASFLASEMLPGLVKPLLLLAWAFLIVRVVQEESLVGDRQFWVTRPYEWKPLLAAKVLFVLAFINFPLLCINSFLLALAGFPPTHYVAGLLWMQLLWILVLFVSIAALASVTRNIPQMLLAVLLVVLYVIGSSALSSIIRKSGFSGDFDLWWGFLVIGTAVAIILLQYSRRNTALSRWLIVGACVLLTVISVATPVVIPDRRMLAREYPVSRGTLPVELGLMRCEKSQGSFSPAYNGEVSIKIPVSVAGIPKDSFLKLDGMIVTLTNANGFRWDSGWKGNALSFFPDQKTAHIVFQVKQNIFDQINAGPVKARLLLAFTRYGIKNQRQFVVPSGEFRLPEIGLCSTESQYSRGIHCLAPLRRPTYLLVTSETAASTCPLGNAEAPPRGEFVRASVQGMPGPAEIGISPVVQVGVDLSNWDWFGGRNVNPGVCPGTPITLSNPEVAGRGALEVQFENLSLEDFRERLPLVP